MSSNNHAAKTLKIALYAERGRRKTERLDFNEAAAGDVMGQ